VTPDEPGLADRTTLGLFLLVIVLGGISPVFVRITFRELDPMWAGASRFFVASLILGSVAVVRRLPLPRGRALLGAVLFGIMGLGVSTVLIYRGLVDTPAGVSQVILSLVPLITFLLAIVHRLERFAWNGLIGALIATVGVGVVFNDQMGANVPVAGMLSILAAAVAIGETTVIVKRFPGAHPISTNAVALMVGAAIFFTASVLFGEDRNLPQSTEIWLTWIYLVFVGTIAVITLFLVVINRMSASASSYQFLLMPLVTVVVSAVVSGERPTPAFLVGGLIVLAGVYVGIVRGRGQPAHEELPSPIPE
jgi:drug/metabolite transporter (DMT)-like permease